MNHSQSTHPNVSRILILEDDLERQRVMRACLDDRFPQYAARFFATASAMIEYISRHDVDELLLISLDHDLEPIDGSTGEGPGTGRDVADCLAERRPRCPVIIHTTNAPAAVGMQAVLADAGWTTIRVAPYDAERWIRESWFRAARNAIVDAAGAGVPA